MPIEVQIEKKYGKNLPPQETQRLCRAFATEQIESQKKASSGSACSVTGTIRT